MRIDRKPVKIRRIRASLTFRRSALAGYEVFPMRRGLQSPPIETFIMAGFTVSLRRSYTSSKLKKTFKDARALIYSNIDALIGRRDYYIISHQKSGRTWLGVALGRIMEERFGLPHHTLIEEYGYLRPRQPQLPRIVFTHAIPRRLLAAQDHDQATARRSILLVRDPRDVAVSWFHQVSQRRAGPRRFTGNLSELIRDPELGIARIVTHMNHLARHWDAFPSLLLIRYEDMQADMGNELARICDTIGLDASPQVIADAVDWSSFDRMQDRERRGFYDPTLEKLNPRDVADPDSFKVRKGRIGSYREEVSDEDIAYLDDYIRAHLHDRFAFYKSPNLITDRVSHAET